MDRIESTLTPGTVEIRTELGNRAPPSRSYGIAAADWRFLFPLWFVSLINVVSAALSLDSCRTQYDPPHRLTS